MISQSQSPDTGTGHGKNGVAKGAQSEPPGTSGHPAGLYVLFFTEMWERFSYYGMRALLVLYMLNYFRWNQAQASNVYKWYTSLVYMTPIAGGYIADWWNRRGKKGNRNAVIIGSILMAIGHFLMAFENTQIFYAALAFLILGNGMFKPNMSTQVGRLYPASETGRKDAAYTIFYMGINLGAFFSPLVCGYLRKTYGFHYGFGAAGVGMVIGLITYVVGLRWVKEISGNVTQEAKSEAAGDPNANPDAHEAPSIFRGGGGGAVPVVFSVGIVLGLGGTVAWLAHKMTGDNATGAGLAGATILAAGWILKQCSKAARDRVLAIYSLALFVVFFWASFEQAGNAMNVWADQETQRYLTSDATPSSALPDVGPPVGFGDEVKSAPAPEVSLGQWWHNLWNPVSTEWFQSINALAVFTLAPLFAWLWTFLDRRKRNPSIPTKMGFGVLFMSISFGVMTLAAKIENGPTATAYNAQLPKSFVVAADKRIYYYEAPSYGGKLHDDAALAALDGKAGEHDEKVPAQAGRLWLDGGQMRMEGVLPDTELNRMLRASAPASFVKKASELALKTSEAKADDKGRFKVSITLDEVPPGIDLRYSGFNPKNIYFNAADKSLTVENIRLADKDYKALLQAAAQPELREALSQLFVDSAKHKVSSWWLFWFYILSTVGELCLSPVGLSMISKLAPARFATMLMGMWLLMTFFGNFVAGALGEIWGSVPPTIYFLGLSAVIGLGALILFALSRYIFKMMHGIR